MILMQILLGIVTVVFIGMTIYGLFYKVVYKAQIRLKKPYNQPMTNPSN